MIRFQCPGCSTGLRVADDRAGKLTRCPSCGQIVRAPARRPGEVEIVEELPVVEDEEEVEEGESVQDEEEEDREEEERPRRPRRRRVEDDEDEEDDDGPPVIRGRPPPRTEEDEDEERRREIVTWNRVMGIVGVVLGIGFTVAAVVFQASGAADFFNPLTTPANAGGCFALLLGLALLVVGAIYAVRG